MKGNVWEQIEDLLHSGQGVQVVLTDLQEIKIPQKRLVKPKNPHKRKWEQYAGCTNAVSRPYCKAPGCKNRLRKDQPIAWSSACASVLIDDALRVLSLLKYNMIERLDQYERNTHGGEALLRAWKEV